MTINELVEYQKKFDSDHKSNFEWNKLIDEDSIYILEFLMIALTGEIGETANIVKKIIRGDFKLQEKKEEIAEEIIDIMIYIIKLSYQLDIDIEKEYLNKMEKNHERFKKYEK